MFDIDVHTFAYIYTITYVDFFQQQIVYNFFILAIIIIGRKKYWWIFMWITKITKSQTKNLEK